MPLTRHDILELYDENPEAVASTILALQAQLEVLTEQVRLLSARVHALEDERAQHSRNSSNRPPVTGSAPHRRACARRAAAGPADNPDTGASPSN